MRKEWTQGNIAAQTEMDFVDRFAEMRLVTALRSGEGSDNLIKAHGYGDFDILLLALKNQVSIAKLVFTERTIRGSAINHFAWKNGYIVVRAGADGDLCLYSVVRDPIINDTIELLCHKFINHRPTEKGTVFAVIRTQTGLGLHRVGAVSAPFCEYNYSKAALEGYNHIIKCLSSKDPCGRLILLEGPPGTGKSYMIRALAGAVEATFVLVGSSLIGEISGPEVLPVLLQAHGEGSDKHPVVLILEDADLALVKRERGDLCRISDVLNLGDGLLGELVDVRVIATSNADHMDLDPAVARPGRMCRHIHIGALGKEAANSLYQSLVKTKSSTVSFGNEATLADVYRAARQDGWTPRRDEEKFRPGDYR